MNDDIREKHVLDTLSEIRKAMSFDKYSPQQTDLVIKAALRVMYAEAEREGFKTAKVVFATPEAA